MSDQDKDDKTEKVETIDAETDESSFEDGFKEGLQDDGAGSSGRPPLEKPDDGDDDSDDDSDDNDDESDESGAEDQDGENSGSDSDASQDEDQSDSTGSSPPTDKSEDEPGDREDDEPPKWFSSYTEKRDKVENDLRSELGRVKSELKTLKQAKASGSQEEKPGGDGDDDQGEGQDEEFEQALSQVEEDDPELAKVLKLGFAQMAKSRRTVQELQSRIDTYEKDRQRGEEEEAIAKINAAHPGGWDLINSKKFEWWVMKQPLVTRNGLLATVNNSDNPSDFIEVIAQYKSDTEEPAKNEDDDKSDTSTGKPDKTEKSALQRAREARRKSTRQPRVKQTPKGGNSGKKSEPSFEDAFNQGIREYKKVNR